MSLSGTVGMEVDDEGRAITEMVRSRYCRVARQRLPVSNGSPLDLGKGRGGLPRAGVGAHSDTSTRHISWCRPRRRWSSSRYWVGRDRC